MIIDGYEINWKNGTERSFLIKNAKKIRAISEKGGICEICHMDLTKSPWIADFHHIDPKTKEIYPSKMFHLSDKNLIDKELEKCILLCSNCHRDTHHNNKKFKENLEKIIFLSKNGVIERLPLRKARKKEKDRARELYQKGLSHDEISKILNFNKQTIYMWVPKNKKFNFDDLDNENKIIDLYENKKLTMKEICILLKCSIRKLKKKILELVDFGKISSFRKNSSNQYIKNNRQISINGKIYENAMEAHKILNINYTTIRCRLNSKSERWIGYYYL